VLLDKMLKKASEEADEVELFQFSSEQSLYKTVLDKIESFDSGFTKGYGLRVVKDKKVGFSFFTGEKGFDFALKNALYSTNFSKVSFNFPSEGAYPEIKGLYSKELADKSIDIADDIIKMISLENKAHSNQNFVSYHEVYSRIVNSNGVDFDSRENYLNVTAAAQFKDCISSAFSFSKQYVDLEAVSQKAGLYAEKFQGGKKVSGNFQVFLHPIVVVELLEAFFIPSIDGEEVFRKQSPLFDKLNKQIVNENISIYENPLREGGLFSYSCDDEGVPACKKALVEDGVLKTFLYDLKAAALTGKNSTGNGLRPSVLSVPIISHSNIELQSKNYLKFSELKGIFVYDVIGVHNVNQTTGDFSLEVANAAFIEGGELIKPVSKCSLVGNYFDLLKSLTLSDDFQNHLFYYGPSWVYNGRIV